MKKISRSIFVLLLALIMTVFMAGGVFAADATLGIDGDPTVVGALIPAWATKGVTSNLYVGVNAAGEEVTGALADQAEVVDGVVTISDVNVTSELGDALNDLGATNTTYLYVNGGEADTAAVVKDSTFVFSDESDGKNANDFTGAGVVFVATGAEGTNTTMTLENANITTDGFGRDAVVVDAYANAFVINSNILTKGSNPLTEAYEGYASTAAQAYMISPPWILGIYGGVRAANVLGKYSSYNLIDSTMESGGWAVISTDDCTQPTVNVLNSTLKVTEYNGADPTGHDSSDSMNGGAALFGYEKNYGSAYGTYNIGSSIENFYGATIDGTTYVTILTGAGPTYFGPSYNGLVLKNAMTGEELYTYEGEGQPTVVTSVFGVMDHQGAADTVLDAGSVWNTEEAVILVRGGQSSTYTVSGAELNPKSGIIFQMMDDDDGYGTSGAGGDTSGEQGLAKWTGEAWGMPTFSSGFSDPNEAGFVAPATGGAYNTTLKLTTDAEGNAVTYTGDVFNGVGTGAGTAAGGLMVNIDANVTLDGAISSTSAVHGLPYNENAVAFLDTLAERYGEGIAPNGGDACTVKYVLMDADGNIVEDEAQAAYIQITEFTMNEYYIISHVINKAMAGSNVLVQVAEGANWNVTSDSYISGLVNDGTVTVADGATLYINGEAYTGEVPAGEVGEMSAGGEGAKVDTSAWVVGENYRTEATGKYSEIMIDNGLFYYVGYKEPVSGVAILDVAFGMKGWLVVGEDGSYTISEDFVELDEPASSGGESGGGESAEGESAEGAPAEGGSEGAPAPEGESPEGEAPAESPEGESPEGEAPAAPPADSPEGESPEGEAPAAPPADSPEGESPAGEAPAAPPAEAPAAEAPAAEAPAAAPADDLYAAYVDYIHEWLLAEDEVNDQMTSDIVENEFMPLVEAGDFTSFPADMLFNGMLENGVALTYDEFVALNPAPAAEAPAEDPWAAYVNYIHEWLLAEDEVNDQMTSDIVENEFMPLVEAGDFTSFPADMLFNGMLENGAALTYDEFVALNQK
ncbi:MAG: hypothetical protein IJJ17_03330 [Parasporobacterium sp.]|nr:hypothetical protein [Parasporobacterium sp.]